MPGRSIVPVFLAVLLLLLLAFGGYLLFKDMESPVIEISHSAEDISPSIPVTVTVTDTASPIKQLKVLVRFAGNEIPVVMHKYSDGALSQHVTFNLSETGLKHGDPFELEVSATDDSFGGFGFGNKDTQLFHMRLDAVPPKVSIKTSTPYVRKGGTGCIAFALNKAVRYAGVMVGDLFFPAFQQETGDYLCFFAFPYNVDIKDYKPLLVAADNAGNRLGMAVPASTINRQFKSDNINIGQNFLDAKAAEFTQMVPEPMSEIERFVEVNSRIRRENALTLLEIGKNTSSEILWKGAFLRLPRAASRAGFADHRTYIYQGEKVDEQTHLGFDLASLKQAPVPAANSGKVVFSGYLGIYGNLVIIDHGLGLQSLYSHMSEIGVDEGALVNKGDIIGKTGATGMAGGDHLHFGILVSGLEVTPLEWLDDHWIKDNIADRIRSASIPFPDFAVSQEEKPAAKK